MSLKNIVENARISLEYFQSLNLPIDEIVEEIAREFEQDVRGVISEEKHRSVSYLVDHLSRNFCNRVYEQTADWQSINKGELERNIASLLPIITSYALCKNKKEGRNIYSILADFAREK